MRERFKVLSLANWLLLAFNIVLFIALIAPWLAVDSPTMQRARKEAELIDMDVYFAKGPFVILVNESFPQKHAFSMADKTLALSAQGYPSEGESAGMRTAMLAVGPDVALSCDYRITDAHASPLQVEVDSILLQTGSKGVWDLNVDGIFDQQLLTDSAAGKFSEQIWYDGKWQQVLPHGDVSPYERELPQIGWVTFDKESGRWTRAANDRQNDLHDKEQGTTPDGGL